MTDIHHCANCGKQTQASRVLCRKCSEAAIAKGICGRCGAAPATTCYSKLRKHNMRCEACDAEAKLLDAEQVQRLSQIRNVGENAPKFRDQDAKENQHETKRGRD